MKHEFRLADIGEGLEEAEIISWLVQPGDHVRRDQPLIEVMTDKSNAELPAPATGTVVQIQGAVGDIITVGELIAVIDDAESDMPAQEPTPDAGPGRATSEAPEPPAASAASIGEPPTSGDPAGDDSPRGDSALGDSALGDSALGDSALAGHAPASAADRLVLGPHARPGTRPKASPATRKAAAARGIDLATVVGSGPGGRILLQDLDQSPPAPAAGGVDANTDIAPAFQPAREQGDAEDADEMDSTAATAAPAEPTASGVAQSPVIAPRPSEPEPSQPDPGQPESGQPERSQPEPRPPVPGEPQEPSGTVPLRGIRRAVARNMAQSWSTIPHIHAFDHIDAQPMLDLRARLKAGDKPTFQTVTPLTFFVAAVAKALSRNRHANASLDLDDETITYHPTINVGVAVATDDGLVVPVLRGADQLDFESLTRNLGALVRSARAGELSREHFLGGTVTITNFGALGGEQAVPLIRPPESLIIGFGSIAERPFVIDHHVVARRTMHIVAGADHRLLDGDSTTAILSSIASSLTDPLGLVL